MTCDPRPLAAALLLPLLLSGCVARTLVDVATAPVRVAGKAVDMATTSQSEADEKRGREIRRREARLGELERDYGRQRRDCERGDARACAMARASLSEMQQLLPSVPVERRR